MKIKLPPEKTNGNRRDYVTSREDKERLQKILDNKEGNGIRNEQTKYFAGIKDPVDGWLNINYRNSDNQIPDISNPEEIQI